MENRLEFCYVMFITAFGKAYGCFALDKSSAVNGEVKVAASFCNAFDSKSYSKPLARKMAVGRLGKAGIIVLDSVVSGEVNYQDVENSTIVHMAMEEDIVDAPSWARKAFQRGSLFYTLRASSVPFNDLVCELDVGNELFNDLRNSVNNQRL
jgi:hypothetical protein